MANYCTGCGAEIPENSKFCISCGAPAGETGPVAAQSQPAGKNEFAKETSNYNGGFTGTYTGEMIPPKGSKYDPITTGGYIGIMLLMCIPVLGIVLAIIWALGGCKKVNKRNLARAALIMMLIGAVFSLIIGFAVKTVVSTALKESGITWESIQEGISDIQNGNVGESISGLIEDVENINQEAEEKGTGWPESLRKYPGGTATETASYRTEITDTTLEDMQAYIEDLKKDGFQYQDFYEFGMSEEDMLGMNGWWATDGNLYLSLSYNEGTVIIDYMTELPDLSSLFE